MHECVISVHTLVESLLVKGDLMISSSTGQRMVEGGRMHRAYQSQAGEDYQAEVPFSYTLQNDWVRLTVQGRADGLRETQIPVVEELKSTLSDLDEVVPNELHQAQLECYGAMYCLTHPTESVLLRLIYLKADQSRSFDILWEAHALIDRFLKLCEQWLEIETKKQLRLEERNGALQTLTFPFHDFRGGQRKMSAEVYRAVRDHEHALIQAPTGIGKTMAVFFPAFKAMGEGMGEKVFYLSARGTLKKVAEESLHILQNHGAPIRFVTLTAKERCCPHPGAGCHPVTCPRAAGYYDRLPQALLEAENCLSLDQETIESLAECYAVCPFEFALQLSLDADVVIGDYNYGFDPRVKLHRFFDEGGDYVLLVDESHNLLDRAREMFSASLDWERVMALKRTLPKQNHSLMKAVDDLRKTFVALRKEEEPSKDKLPEEMIKAIRKFCQISEPYVDHPPAEPYAEQIVDLYFQCRNFLLVYENMDACMRILYQRDGNQLAVKLFCMDPASRLESAYDKVRCGMFFSATLTPMWFFARMLGLQKSRKITLPSPFPKENLQVLLYSSISTAYRQREASLEELARVLQAFAEAHPGKTLAFFPSYRYMEAVHTRFRELCPEYPAPMQETGMDEKARLAFLEHFDEPGSLMAFAVMGGLFGEGVDLQGEKLTAAIIVGVGLPQIDEEREALRQYYDEQDENGFAYAYLYPGMNRVLQAAGRVIRTPEDRGTVLLIDNRFAHIRYRELFPEMWQNLRRVSDPKEIKQMLLAFRKDEALPKA